MTRWMHPPERDRPRKHEQFDPVIEGARYGLSRELSLAIWERVCTDATGGRGQNDMDDARRRFHEIALHLAARGGRLSPDIGRVTRVEVEHDGDTARVSGSNALTIRAPGRETLVATEARRWAHMSGEPAVRQSDSSAQEPEQDEWAIGRSELPGVADVTQAMVALQHSAQRKQVELPMPVLTRGSRRIDIKRTFGQQFTDVKLHADNAEVPAGQRAFTRAQSGTGPATLHDQLVVSVGDDREQLQDFTRPDHSRGPFALDVEPEASNKTAFERGRTLGESEAREAPRRTSEHLDAATRWRMSQVFGFDFNGVSIRRDSPLATGRTRALVKEDEVHFREGDYRPGTRDGDRLIAHELAHLVQQRGGRGERAGSRKDLEREADRAAALAMQGRAAPIVLRAEPAIRYEFNEDEDHDEVSSADAEAGDENADGAEADDAKAGDAKADGVEADNETNIDGTQPHATPLQSEAFIKAGDAAIDDTSELLDQIGRDANSRGIPLPAPLRIRMERIFGANLQDVRIHIDKAAAQATRGVAARAFTLGEDVYFGAGEFAPDSQDGFELLAHELTHVLQWQEGRVQASPGGLSISEPSDSLEEEARSVAKHAVESDGPGSASRRFLIKDAPNPGRGDTDEPRQSVGRAGDKRAGGRTAHGAIIQRSPISWLVKQVGKRAAVKAVKNYIKKNITRKIKELTREKLKIQAKKFTQEADEIIGILDDPWWMTAIEMIPIAGDAIGAARFIKQLDKVWDRIKSLERKIDASLDTLRRVKADYANKAHHIFSQARHKLGPLLAKFGGSQEAAFDAIRMATEAAIKGRRLTGPFETAVKVGGMQVTVRGAVVDGVVKIGTAFIP